MASSKSHFHARSNSLPSRPHPLVIQCQEHLDRLRVSSYSSSLSQKLEGLQDLHDCVEKLVQLPLTQEAILHEHQENSVDELLDGSLKLLDECTAAKDSLFHTKECTCELQSIIRRRRGGEVVLTVEAKKFLTSRKVMRKANLKALESMKGKAKKGNSSSSSTSSSSSCTLVSLLREVEGVTLSTFESLMNFISGSTQAKPNSWLLVSKLMRTRRVGYAPQEAEENEFALVDAAIQSFVFNLTRKNMQNQLENLETRIQDLEEGLEFLFRRLIKTRVSLLNILNLVLY